MPVESSLKIYRWWWLLLASFAIFLVALAPATLLEWAASGSPNAVARFEADAGTVWKGRGRIALASSATPVTIPIAWRFDPLALLGLRLGYLVEASAPSLSGAAHIGLGFGDYELRDAALVMDARLLSIAHAAAALLAPAGTIRLRQAADERLAVRPGTGNDGAWRVDGSTGLNAEQLVFGGIINAQVGSHEMKLRGDGASMNVSILRSSGPLKLEGAGTLALGAPRRFTFAGFATAATDSPATLKQLGPTMADGRQRIDLNVPW